MRIKHCIASKPGLFDNRQLEFDERMSVILGRNDSGKTLLSRALVDLFHSRTIGSGFLNNGEWEDLYVETLIDDSEKEYRIARNGEKFFKLTALRSGKETDIFSADLKQSNNGSFQKEILRALEENASLGSLFEIFGKIGGEALVKLCYQPSPADMEGSPAKGFDTIRGVLVDDTSNFYDLFISLSAHYGEAPMGLRLNNPVVSEILKMEGELKTLEKKTQIIDLEYLRYEKLIRERRERESSISKKKNILNGLAEKKTSAELLLDKIHAREKLESQITAITKNLQDEDQLKAEVEGMTAGLCSKFPQFRDFTDSQRNNLKKIQDLYRDLRDANENLHNLRFKIFSRKRIIKNTVLSLNIASLVAVFLTYGDIFFTAPPESKTLLITGIMISALLSVVVLLSYTIITGRSRVAADLLLMVEDLEGRIEKLLRENNMCISEYRMETLYEFLLQYFEEYSEYTEIQMEILRLNNAMRDESQIRLMTAELEELRGKQAGLTGDIMDGIPPGEDKRIFITTAASVLDYVFGVERDIENLEKEIREEERVLDQLDAEIRATSFQEDEKKECLNRKKKLGSALEKLKVHDDTMRYVMRLLGNTVELRWQERVERLIKRSADVFHRLTERQYITKIDNEQFRGALNGIFPDSYPAALSHLLQFSIRMAVTDFLIDLNLSLPLIIDDPFLFMDEVRIARLRDILEDISESRQVIIFTHSVVNNQWGSVLEI